MFRLFYFLSPLLVIIFLSGYSQNYSDSIVVVKSFFGTKYYMNGHSIMLKAVYEQLEDCKDAEQEIIDARKSISFANVLGGVGGFFIGWPLGQAVSGKEPNVTMAIVGVALTFLSVPLVSKGNMHLEKAVNIYNKQLAEKGKNK